MTIASEVVDRGDGDRDANHDANRDRERLTMKKSLRSSFRAVRASRKMVDRRRPVRLKSRKIHQILRVARTIQSFRVVLSLRSRTNRDLMTTNGDGAAKMKRKMKSRKMMDQLTGSRPNHRFLHDLKKERLLMRNLHFPILRTVKQRIRHRRSHVDDEQTLGKKDETPKANKIENDPADWSPNDWKNKTKTIMILVWKKNYASGDRWDEHSKAESAEKKQGTMMTWMTKRMTKMRKSDMNGISDTKGEIHCR